MLPFDFDKLKTELLPAYENAEEGLPDEVFTYISTITPLINVDLLTRNDKGEVLLSWRYDYRRSGWHIPGGIIRYKETFAQRIAEVARLELGTEVTFDSNPVRITEIFVPERRRGHGISLLYNCKLLKDIDIDTYNDGKAETDNGYLRWFDKCPDVMVYGQRRAYEGYLKELLDSF